MAANVAAMAPGTNIGAAHPVELGAAGQASKPKDEVMEAKVAHDSAAYLQAIAQKRGRNAAWAAEVVEKSTSIPSAVAVKERVVDFEASSLDDLLGKLKLSGAAVERFDMTARQKALSAVSDPNIAMILMTVGVAGVMIELYAPGLILPGIVGAFSLIVAFYSFQTLSANFAGLLLIALGLLLFLLEFKVHSFGLLVVSGMACFLFGALMLFKNASGGLEISRSIIASTLGTMSAALLALLALAKRVLGRKARTGAEGLVGARGVARSAKTVAVHGELWDAESVSGPLAPGEAVVVAAVDGLTLKVRKKG
jgi:membrane-bound serine protease (ClpP class)